MDKKSKRPASAKTLNVVMIPTNSGTDDPLGYALELLSNGVQSVDAFALVTEHFTASLQSKEKLAPAAIKWVATALSKIANGEDPKQALGIMRPVGRQRPKGVLESKVSAFIELQMRTGVSKTEAVDLAASNYHKDRRHIQRLSRWENAL